MRGKPALAPLGLEKHLSNGPRLKKRPRRRCDVDPRHRCAECGWTNNEEYSACRAPLGAEGDDDDEDDDDDDDDDDEVRHLVVATVDDTIHVYS